VPYTVVVVLHDSERELALLLGSLERHAHPRPQVVVVDSGSRDGGPRLAREHGAEVVELDGNAGFGAGSDAGVERARHPVTVLLNPDCELIDGSLGALADRVAARPGALHAPRLLEADGSVQRSAHPLPGTLGAVFAAPMHPPLLPHALAQRIEPFRARRTRPVGWAIAACLAGATATLRRLGPFDPSVRLFAEDMDLCLRARAAGIATLLHPDLRIRHAGGHATLRDGEPYELLARRRRAVVGAVRGPRALALDDLAQGITFATRATAHAVAGGDAERPRRQLAALRRARRSPARAGAPAPRRA
jgi:N-acetylglucosaminyl-diphospho-decaprenol L-rhamnosyltransferase